MIPYLQTTDNNKITCNTDLVILDSGYPILISLCDLHIRNRKICSDMISKSYDICLRDRESLVFDKRFYCQDSYRYKSTKMENELTHTIIYSNRINEYCINWNNEGKSEIITKYLRNVHYLPVTQDIVEKVLQSESEYYSCVGKCDVYTNNPIYKDLRVYKINVHYFKEKLNSLKLEGFKDDFDWSKIENIEDYIFTFLNPIKEKLKQNIRVLYNPNNINPKMFEGKKKPLKGQIPIIQSGLEVLKKDRFLYVAAEMGVGKTLCATKINHCHHAKNYITLVVAPAITLTQWKEEIKDSVEDNVNIYIIKKTSDFINIYNKTKLHFDKPTYFIVGKETFKLDSKKIAGVNIRTRLITYKKQVRGTYWTDIRNVEEKITVACCPDCGKPLKNELRKTEDIFFNEADFQGNPKKSNYKCSNCGSVLWQNTYDKTKKSSLIRFIKTKNIHFDSIICDEIHEQNGNDSIVSNATRTLFNYTRKIILLSGTTNNGYSSSMFNLLLGLLPNKLKANEVLDLKQFIKTYGTLMAITNCRDGEYYSSGRSKIKDSDFKEIEGINPIVFAKYLVQNYIFATLDDLGEDLPELKEIYMPINQDKVMENNETILWNDIKTENAFNAKMYVDSVIKHYINNPFQWDAISMQKGDETKDIQPRCIDDTILPKEQKLLDIIKKELAEGRKCCVYVDFNNGGQYMQGNTIAERIESLLKNNNIKTFTLKTSVPTYERKELLEKKKDNFDVLITNRKLIKVGLNLVYIPTYINYMPSYFVNEVSQGNRRGYRVNSTLENRIYHLYYENSCENSIIKRYQRKTAESQAIEGKFNVCLENDDIRTMSQLGKKIIEGQGEIKIRSIKHNIIN